MRRPMSADLNYPGGDAEYEHAKRRAKKRALTIRGSSS
jgi:hypothetical protein